MNVVLRDENVTCQTLARAYRNCSLYGWKTALGAKSVIIDGYLFW
jgi:hypothetical protein